MYGDMSASKTMDLLKFPEKAVSCLLEKLNLWNLMNLRLVCHGTKAWVEKPQVLKRFCLPVKERKFLKKIGKSNVKWSNLQVTCDTNDLSSAWIRSDEYTRLFSKLNASLRVLKFTEQRVPFINGVDMILSNCTQLEELVLGTLDISCVNLSVSETVLNCLSNLQAFSISYVAWRTEDDLQIFPKILSNCKQMKFFKIPYILTATLYSLYPAMEEDEIDQKLVDITKDVLLRPLKSLLEQHSTKKCLLKYVDVENFEFEHLVEDLAPACKRSGCLLLNVLDASERAWTGLENQFCDTIGSLLNCTKNLDLTRLCNVEAVTISEDFASSSDTDKKYANALLPALKTVNLTLTISILPSERMASCFLQQKRQTIESVSVKFEELKGSAQASVFRSPKFAASLPNLRSLSLDGFDGKPDDYLLFWKSFPLLENVQLQNCRTLNDYALIGSDASNPAICSLKFIKKCTLEYGDLTDVSLKGAIARFPLEVLHLYQPKITFAGLSYLNTHLISKTLSVFYCMKPDDCTEEAFKGFLESLVNIKKYEILF